MNPFHEKISTWLARPVPERAINTCLDSSVILSTDIGLHRKENQDRVAAIKVDTKVSGEHKLIAIAVADGMGGQRDGAKCATLALSSFFYALATYRTLDIQQRTLAAINHANNSVFRFANGNGGTTLSAIVIDHKLQPLTVHLGDSRIYSFGDSDPVKRLTTDDSLAEVVGGHARELVQFIGMGEGMQPHLAAIPHETKNLLITTDGIHFIGSPLLEKILSNSNNIKMATERLAALARWCGGPDNASSASIDINTLTKLFFTDKEGGIQLWDPFGSLTAIWVDANDLRIANPIVCRPQNVNERQAESTPKKKNRRASTKQKRKTSNKASPKTVANRAPKEELQLEIQIESTPDPDHSNDHSK